MRKFPPKTDDNNQKDHSHHNSINSCQCYSSHIKRAVDWADIFFVFESLISQNFGLSYNERCYGFVEIHLIVCWMGSKFRVNWLALFISRGSDADGDDHKIQTQFYWIWLHILYAYEYECIWCLHCTRGRYWLMALLHIQIAYTQHNKIITRRRARALVLKLACLAAQQPHNANDCCIFGSIILLLSLLLLHYVWWLLWPFCMHQMNKLQQIVRMHNCSIILQFGALTYSNICVCSAVEVLDSMYGICLAHVKHLWVLWSDVNTYSTFICGSCIWYAHVE